jgi:hypothetical protein
MPWVHHPQEYRVAYFISPHGLGHAARAAGVMAAVQKANPGVGFEIFTKVPPWFFQDSLDGPFRVHQLLTDIGIVQQSPFHEDLELTRQKLDAFLPFDNSLLSGLARKLETFGCDLVICDIAPMGIAVAKEAGIPSLLVENFTWDWIYDGYAGLKSQCRRHVTYLRELFEQVEYHVQTEPICRPRRAALKVLPVSRSIRKPAAEIRRELELPVDGTVVIITLGGIPHDTPFLKHLPDRNGLCFLVPGGSRTIERHQNIVLLPHHSRFFHPDLINASDVVVGKAGYSTLAEAYYAGIPFGYISRSTFRESRVLVDFIASRMAGQEIGIEAFHDGTWISHLHSLLATPRKSRAGTNGAEKIAGFVLGILGQDDIQPIGEPSPHQEDHTMIEQLDNRKKEVTAI